MRKCTRLQRKSHPEYAIASHSWTLRASGVAHRSPIGSCSLLCTIYTIIMHDARNFYAYRHLKKRERRSQEAQAQSKRALDCDCIDFLVLRALIGWSPRFYPFHPSIKNIARTRAIQQISLIANFFLENQKRPVNRDPKTRGILPGFWSAHPLGPIRYQQWNRKITNNNKNNQQ